MLPSELIRAERIEPLAGATEGHDVTIDRGVLAEPYERLAQTVAAVERGNNRAAGVGRWWRCTDAIWRAGKPPAECAAPR